MDTKRDLVTYLVDIPEPSAKRMENNRTLVFSMNEGWGTGFIDKVKLEEDVKTFRFSCPSRYVSRNEVYCMDGDSFDVTVEFSNDSGTRTEVRTLLPRREGPSKITDEDRDGLISAIEWYRDRYHKKDINHSKMIERIKITQNPEEFEIIQKIVDGWLDY